MGGEIQQARRNPLQINDGQDLGSVKTNNSDQEITARMAH